MKVELNSAEETRAITNEYFETKKKKELKPLLKVIKKDITIAAKHGKSETEVGIPVYLEEEILNLLEKNGYKVTQLDKYNWLGCYGGNPPYVVSWKDEGE